MGCVSIELGCLSIELGCLSIELGKKTNLQAGWSFCYLLFSISSTNKESSSHLSIFASNAASTSCCSLYRFCTFSKSRSEEHTSELQSRGHLVCRLLLEKKKDDLV